MKGDHLEAGLHYIQLNRFENTWHHTLTEDHTLPGFQVFTNNKLTQRYRPRC